MRVQVLGKEKLNEVISMIHAEEGRRGVMFKLSSIDGFSIVVAKPKKFSPNPVRETQRFEGSKNLTMKNFSVLKALTHQRQVLETSWKTSEPELE